MKNEIFPEFCGKSLALVIALSVLHASIVYTRDRRTIDKLIKKRSKSLHVITYYSKLNHERYQKKKQVTKIFFRQNKNLINPYNYHA